MTLTDAGPLVALINRNDPNHELCVGALDELPAGPLITTWPSFTEAMHILHRADGIRAQQELWRMVFDGRLALRDISTQEMVRSAELMDTYRDRPMDLADASLVATAETLSRREVFALDSDFYNYRLADGSTLRVIPARANVNV